MKEVRLVFDSIFELGIYLLTFIASLFALSGLDFNRFIKQGKVAQGQLLYLMIALCIAYLAGSLLLKISGH